MTIRKNIVLPKHKLKVFLLALDSIKTLFRNINKIKTLKGLSNNNYLIELIKSKSINSKLNNICSVKVTQLKYLLLKTVMNNLLTINLVS